MFSCKWLLLVLVLPLGLNAVGAESVTNLDAARVFRFSFKLNEPLTYSVATKTKTVTDTSSTARNAMNRNLSEMRYKMRMTAIASNKDGTMRVHYEPLDYEQDVEISTLQGKTTITTRGMNIVGKLNDFVTVDTAKDIGTADAQNLKLGVYGPQLSGYFDFDPQGEIKNCAGDLPFVDYWQQLLKNSYGLFRITFSTNAVNTHSSWSNSVTSSKMSGVALNGDTLTQTRVYSREPDATYGSVASFSLYESEDYKDLSAYVERGGQRTPIMVPQSDNNVNATYDFDYQHGHLIAMKMTQKMTVAVKAMNQGIVSTTQSDSESETSIKLITP